MELFQDKTIGVLMGGLSSERAVSLASGKAVLQAIRGKGLNAVAIDVDDDITHTLEREGIDLAFIALHGSYGEDGTIQGLLEYLKIPYTGSGVLSSALAFNKVASKAIFKAEGIPTAEFRTLRRGEDVPSTCPVSLPAVAKPSDEGSSIGVTVVREPEQWPGALKEAFLHSEEILTEEFISGKLLAIGIDGEHPLLIVHIIPRSGFYDYEAKYTPGKTDYHCPADLTEEETRRCQDVSVKVFQVLKARGMARVDVILDLEGTPKVLELNTIPGLTPTSLLPKAAQQAGMEFSDMILKMLKQARLDYTV